jgi:hypothetical protein
VSGPGSLAVAGGAASIAADFDDLRRLAAGLDELASIAQAAIAATTRLLLDPRLLPAAALDPIGAAHLAEALAAATGIGLLTLASCQLPAAG